MVRKNIRRRRVYRSNPKIEWPDTVKIGNLEFRLRTEKKASEARYTCNRKTLDCRYFKRTTGRKQFQGPVFTAQYDTSGVWAVWARGTTLKEACRKLHQSAMRHFKSLAKFLDYEVEK